MWHLCHFIATNVPIYMLLRRRRHDEGLCSGVLVFGCVIDYDNYYPSCNDAKQQCSSQVVNGSRSVYGGLSMYVAFIRYNNAVLHVLWHYCQETRLLDRLLCCSFGLHRVRVNSRRFEFIVFFIIDIVANGALIPFNLCGSCVLRWVTHGASWRHRFRLRCIRQRRRTVALINPLRPSSVDHHRMSDCLNARTQLSVPENDAVLVGVGQRAATSMQFAV